MKRSSAERSTRMRERAQQSWPALPNTAIGAAAAARSRSASAKITFADLPPSSSVTRLIVSAARAAMRRPTSVEPVNATLATSGCSTIRSPTTRPGAHDHVEDALGHPGLDDDLLELDCRERRQLGRLEDDGVACRQRRAELPRGDRQREVPGRDQADDAERLAERHVDAAVDRDRVAEQPLGRAGVVVEDVGDHADLAAGVGDRLADVARLEPGQVLGVVARRRPHRRIRSARSPGPIRRQAGNASRARAIASSASSTPAWGSTASTSSVAGSMTHLAAHPTAEMDCRGHLYHRRGA